MRKKDFKFFDVSLYDEFCTKLQKLDLYRSWHVMKNVAWSMIVYIPIMIAFAGAFHCFLDYHSTFGGPITSVLKVLTMVLGEFEFEDNFVYEKVKENHGSNWSVQIMLVLFIVYGSLIVMNLMTAWIVISQRDTDETEVILVQQRIEEISGMAKITGPVFKVWNKSCPHHSKIVQYKKLFWISEL